MQQWNKSVFTFCVSVRGHTPLVYIMDDAKRFGKSPKLQPLWKGPAIVARKLGPVLYEMIKKKGFTVLHNNKLKPCLLETLPRWVSQARRQLQYVAQYEKEDKRKHVSVDDKVQDVESAEETIKEETPCGNQEMLGDRDLSALEEAISPGLESKDTAEDEQIRNPVRMSRNGRRVQPPSRYTTLDGLWTLHFDFLTFSIISNFL